MSPRKSQEREEMETRQRDAWTMHFIAAYSNSAQRLENHPLHRDFIANMRERLSTETKQKIFDAFMGKIELKDLRGKERKMYESLKSHADAERALTQRLLRERDIRLKRLCKTIATRES